MPGSGVPGSNEWMVSKVYVGGVIKSESRGRMSVKLIVPLRAYVDLVRSVHVTVSSGSGVRHLVI